MLITLQKEINSLEKVQSLLMEFAVNLSESGYVKVSTEADNYSTAKTNFGNFPVIAGKVEPYLDGYKVHLRVGNITTASFNGAKVTVKWGLEPNPYMIAENLVEGYDPLNIVKKKQKSKEFDISNIFRPGSYCGFDVILSPAKPEEVKAIYVKLSFSRISLHR